MPAARNRAVALATEMEVRLTAKEPAQRVALMPWMSKSPVCAGRMLIVTAPETGSTEDTTTRLAGMSASCAVGGEAMNW
jgi:hypothetical protein